jgi:hypothetical protein
MDNKKIAGQAAIVTVVKSVIGKGFALYRRGWG